MTLMFVCFGFYLELTRGTVGKGEMGINKGRIGETPKETR